MSGSLAVSSCPAPAAAAREQLAVVAEDPGDAALDTPGEVPTPQVGTLLLATHLQLQCD